MSKVHAEIQAVSVVESLKNPIDAYAVLDRQIKALTEQADVLKSEIKSNGFGKFRGEKYGVTITEKIRTGSVDMKALCAKFGITDEDLAALRAEPTIYTEVKATV